MTSRSKAAASALSGRTPAICEQAMRQGESRPRPLYESGLVRRAYANRKGMVDTRNLARRRNPRMARTSMFTGPARDRNVWAGRACRIDAHDEVGCAGEYLQQCILCGPPPPASRPPALKSRQRMSPRRCTGPVSSVLGEMMNIPRSGRGRPQNAAEIGGDATRGQGPWGGTMHRRFGTSFGCICGRAAPADIRGHLARADAIAGMRQGLRCDDPAGGLLGTTLKHRSPRSTKRLDIAQYDHVAPDGLPILALLVE